MKGGIRVKHLIEALEELPPNSIVVLSKDAEGNAYRLLESIDLAMYHPEEKEIGFAYISEEMRKEGYTDEDIAKPEDGYVSCIVLWAEHKK